MSWVALISFGELLLLMMHLPNASCHLLLSSALAAGRFCSIYPKSAFLTFTYFNAKQHSTYKGQLLSFAVLVNGLVNGCLLSLPMLDDQGQLSAAAVLVNSFCTTPAISPQLL